MSTRIYPYPLGHALCAQAMDMMLTREDTWTEDNFETDTDHNHLYMSKAQKTMLITENVKQARITFFIDNPYIRN